jgi:uracil-DNA glycosylase
LWNIFPFHPHQAGKPDSNRTPTQSEIQLGFTFLKDLLNLFSIQYTVTVGRRAQAMLMDNNIHYIYLRHPAHGGINQFKRGMQGLFATPNPGIENNF